MIKEREKSTSAHTRTRNTMPRTCASIATIEEEEPRRLGIVCTLINFIIPKDFVRTAISLSTTSKEKIKDWKKQNQSKQQCRQAQMKRQKIKKRIFKIAWRAMIACSMMFRCKKSRMK